MPARRIKTLWTNPKERSHREHRSKKGRTKKNGIHRIRAYKRKLEELHIEELDYEIHQTKKQ